MKITWTLNDNPLERQKDENKEKQKILNGKEKLKEKNRLKPLG